ncbi:MAG: hypothetical protein LBT92_02765, partial [Rickettsiales bacterium]|nr:hypothetical protein [Rickettsiales bacterium]
MKKLFAALFFVACAAAVFGGARLSTAQQLFDSSSQCVRCTEDGLYASGHDWWDGSQKGRVASGCLVCQPGSRFVRDPKSWDGTGCEPCSGTGYTEQAWTTKDGQKELLFKTGAFGEDIPYTTDQVCKQCGDGHMLNGGVVNGVVMEGNSVCTKCGSGTWAKHSLEQAMITKYKSEYEELFTRIYDESRGIMRNCLDCLSGWVAKCDDEHALCTECAKCGTSEYSNWDRTTCLTCPLGFTSFPGAGEETIPSTKKCGSNTCGPNNNPGTNGNYPCLIEIKGEKVAACNATYDEDGDKHPYLPATFDDRWIRGCYACGPGTYAEVDKDLSASPGKIGCVECANGRFNYGNGHAYHENGDNLYRGCYACPQGTFLRKIPSVAAIPKAGLARIEESNKWNATVFGAMSPTDRNMYVCAAATNAMFAGKIVDNEQNLTLPMGIAGTAGMMQDDVFEFSKLESGKLNDSAYWLSDEWHGALASRCGKNQKAVQEPCPGGYLVLDVKGNPAAITDGTSAYMCNVGCEKCGSNEYSGEYDMICRKARPGYIMSNDRSSSQQCMEGTYDSTFNDLIPGSGGGLVDPVYSADGVEPGGHTSCTLDDFNDDSAQGGKRCRWCTNPGAGYYVEPGTGKFKRTQCAPGYSTWKYVSGTSGSMYYDLNAVGTTYNTTPCEECPRGYEGAYKVPGNTQSDYICKGCGEREYSSGGVTGCTECVYGNKIEKENGMNTGCVACGSTEYSNEETDKETGVGVTNCKVCPAGAKLKGIKDLGPPEVWRRTGCELCTGSTYSASTPSYTCTSVPAGAEVACCNVDATGAVACSSIISSGKICRTSNDLHNGIKYCDAGYYSNSSTFFDCTECGVDHYLDKWGSGSGSSATSCTERSAGYKLTTWNGSPSTSVPADGKGATAQTPCVV